MEKEQKKELRYNPRTVDPNYADVILEEASKDVYRRIVENTETQELSLNELMNLVGVYTKLSRHLDIKKRESIGTTNNPKLTIEIK